MPAPDGIDDAIVLYEGAACWFVSYPSYTLNLSQILQPIPWQGFAKAGYLSIMVFLKFKTCNISHISHANQAIELRLIHIQGDLDDQAVQKTGTD
jgi:hypothetical protein